ncbi:hypothetical protein D3C81_1749580 [compost metagenome]
MVAVGVAEVELRHALQVDAELGQHGLVEPELLAQLVDEGGVAGTGFARHHGGRVARRHPDQEEVDDDHAKDDHDGLSETGAKKG